MSKENVKNSKKKDVKEKELEVSPNAEASFESDRELSPEELDEVAGGEVKDYLREKLSQWGYPAIE